MVLLSALQILEKGSNSIPLVGGPLSSVFGVASVITEKVQKLKEVPISLREIALEIQALLEIIEGFLREHREHFSMTDEFMSSLSELEMSDVRYSTVLLSDTRTGCC